MESSQAGESCVSAEPTDTGMVMVNDHELLWHLQSRGEFLGLFSSALSDLREVCRQGDSWWVDVLAVSSLMRHSHGRVPSPLCASRPAIQAAILWGVCPWIIVLPGHRQKLCFYFQANILIAGVKSINLPMLDLVHTPITQSQSSASKTQKTPKALWKPFSSGPVVLSTTWSSHQTQVSNQCPTSLQDQ